MHVDLTRSLTRMINMDLIFGNFLSADFRCEDRRSCVSKSLLCDGRSHCHDGSDEVGCPSVDLHAPQKINLKCRFGSKPCGDGTECVLLSHVCDGERDCQDGSDEEECGKYLSLNVVFTMVIILRINMLLYLFRRDETHFCLSNLMQLDCWIFKAHGYLLFECLI